MEFVMNVIVTGGSRGIGAECVRRFAAAGYKVGFLYKNSDEAAVGLAHECSALAIKADVSSRSQVFEAVEAIEAVNGNTDVLINNAGVSDSGLFCDFDETRWRNTIDTNLGGAFYASQAVFPSMLKAKSGCIINISSMWGLTGASCEVPYSAAKAGLIGMTKAMAHELGPSGIRVNCIAPGVIDTDMNAGYSGADMQALCDETPLGRIGNTADIAEAALFLASDAAAFITGEVLNVSGGFVI